MMEEESWNARLLKSFGSPRIIRVPNNALWRIEAETPNMGYRPAGRYAFIGAGAEWECNYPNGTKKAVSLKEAVRLCALVTLLYDPDAR